MTLFFNPRHQRLRGFTLVELLTVIAIIALLITILIPAVNAVRVNAQVTASKSTLGTIDTALAAFRAEQRVGGRLPPSASDRPGSPPNNYNLAGNPYENLFTGGGPGGTVQVSGAGLLVWALAGADLLGTPGFAPVRSTSRYWAEDTNFGNSGDPGAYFVDNTTSLPKFARTAPFVDLGKVKVTAYNRARQSFDIPAEVEALQRSYGSTQGEQRLNARRQYPMFLDAFGFPILFWRADPAGVALADFDPSANTDPRRRGIYHYADNADLLGWNANGSPNATRPLILRPTRETTPHRAKYFDYAPPYDPQDHETYKGFWHYVRNEAVQSRLMPHNADSYLLVSPGRDGLYGTADDITNFDHNGAHVEND